MTALSRIVLALLLGAMFAGATMLLPSSYSNTLTPHAQGQIMAPELSPNLGWLNTDRPLRFDGDLKGHVVVLDFWTYCCINCIHILPDLEYLEDKYKNDPVVVIGVHSAKFAAEGDRESIRQAMFRYDIHHPVVIDSGMQIWSKYGIRGWPGFAVIGTDGELIGIAGGEGQRELLDITIQKALAAGASRGDVADTRVEFALDAMVAPATGLTYPGKVLADRSANAGSGYVFIADSSGDRVIVATYPDAAGRSDLVKIVGTGERGNADGPSDTAQFNDPQGLALDSANNLLYIADTKNHTIRTLDLTTWRVATIAGTGEQSYDRTGGGSGTAQGISSPWDVELSPDRSTLYIAMAGPHQIWSMDMASRKVERLAGSGRENSIDGPLEEAALAQPSGLALSADGQRLYFADSESSSVRVVDLDKGEVRTTIGHNVTSSFENGLFEFGDVDGAYPRARLQHVLGVTLLPGEGDTLLVADTYNSKLKRLDAEARSITTLAGGSGSALRFDEPAGLHHDPASGLTFIADTNNHRVVIYDPETGAHNELTIAGLGASGQPEITTEGAQQTSISANADAGFTLAVSAKLPGNAKTNSEFPATVRVSRLADGAVLAQRTLRTPELPVEVGIPAGAAKAGQDLIIELSFAWCSQGDMGTCMPANIVWQATLEDADADRAAVSATIQ